MKARGFSLLEVLVTLVVVSMTVALVMQALMQVLALRGRVIDNERAAHSAAIGEAWFRDSVGGLVATLSGTRGDFRGDTSTWSGLSLSPLRGVGLGPVTWALEETDDGRGLRLVKIDPSVGRVTVRGVSRSARWRYIDSAGDAHDAWPVAALVDQRLPRAVVLDDPAEDAAILWWAGVPAGPGVPQSVRNMIDYTNAPGI